MGRDVFSAIADETRREIVLGLSKRPMAVHEIADRFDISRPAISKHLRVLMESGLVTARRTGKENVYDLRPEAFQEVADWLSLFWSARLHLLKRLAEKDA